MTTDGHTETLAFTEADGSLSTGFLIKGSSWGRGQDTVGVAYMRDTISADRINFFIQQMFDDFAPITFVASRQVANVQAEHQTGI